MTHVLQESAESENPRGHLDPQGFREHVEFHTYLPPDDLKPFLEHFWTLTWHDLPEPYYSEQVMHRPAVDVFLSLDGSGIQGTFRNLRTYVAHGTGRIIGARFLPGAFHLVWDGAMADLQDTNVPLEHVFPEIDVPRLLELDDEGVIAELTKVLRARLPHDDNNVVVVNQIIALSEDEQTQRNVASIAREIHRSERWVQQLFQDYVGVGLKWVLLRRKLLAAAQAIRTIDKPNWSTIAYDLGYSSQQHFIADFKKITGKTPTQYRKSLGQPSSDPAATSET